MRVLVLGASGHGKVVADILQMLNIEVMGFLDDNPSIWGTSALNLPVLGAINQYTKYKSDGLVLGIGSNCERKAVVERLGEPAKALWHNAIHPSATIARSTRLGHGIVIASQAVVNPDTEIGNHVIINTGATVDHDCKVNAYVHIAPGVNIAGNVQIGMGVLLGIGSKVIPNRTIGQWTVVGAGATILHNVPENVTAKGTPARW